jgi:hypothetical protein
MALEASGGEADNSEAHSDGARSATQARPARSVAFQNVREQALAPGHRYALARRLRLSLPESFKRSHRNPLSFAVARQRGDLFYHCQ